MEQVEELRVDAADFARVVVAQQQVEGGVCGGLGQASGMESWIWRLVFVLFTLTFGFGVVIYLLLWIFVPDEEIGITKHEY